MNMLENIENSDVLLTATDLGYMFNLSAVAFNKSLRDHGIMEYKNIKHSNVVRKVLVPTEEYKDQNIAKVFHWNRGRTFGTTTQYRPKLAYILADILSMEVDEERLQRYLDARKVVDDGTPSVV